MFAVFFSLEMEIEKSLYDEQKWKNCIASDKKIIFAICANGVISKKYTLLCLYMHTFT